MNLDGCVLYDALITIITARACLQSTISQRGMQSQKPSCGELTEAILGETITLMSHRAWKKVYIPKITPYLPGLQ